MYFSLGSIPIWPSKDLVVSSMPAFFNYGLETVVSVLFSNTCTRLPYNEREMSNTARSEAECSIENFEFIVR